MGTIFRKEIQLFFGSLMAYVIIGFFLTLVGLWVWILPSSNVLEGGYAELTSLFRMAPYVLLFLAPAITMGLLAEERKAGTLELLLTSPIRPLALMVGKYLASLFIVILTLALTLPYVLTIYCLASPKGNIDGGALWGSYIGLLLLAAIFLAIGLCVSAATHSQVVAFLVSTLACFLLYQGFEAWSTLQSWHQASLFISQLGILYHYEALSRGVIDLRDIAYFLSSIAMALTIGYLLVCRS
jgi:ABC-2 type transport system permease protein